MSGHYLLPAQQVVLVERAGNPPGIDHAARFALMGRTAPATPPAAQPWWIFQQKPAALLADSFEPPRRRHDDLHVYRVGFQTVGQSWTLWPNAPKQLPADVPTSSIDHAARFALMGRTAPAAPTVAQPWWIWKQPARFDIPDEPPRRVTDNLFAFRQPAPSAPQPAQPWWIWQQPIRIEQAEPQIRPPLHDLTAYRHTVQAAQSQPWWLLRWTPPRFWPDEFDYRPKRYDLPRAPGAAQPIVDYADAEDTLTVTIDDRMLAMDEVSDLFSADLTDQLLDVDTDDAPWPIEPNDTLH